MIETRFTRLLGCTAPIQLAPMPGLRSSVAAAEALTGDTVGETRLGDRPMPAQVRRVEPAADIVAELVSGARKSQW